MFNYYNMKKIIVLSLLFISANVAFSQETWKVITIVESIVPNGLGRSRIIENQGSVDITKLTTERDGNSSKSGSVSRSEVKESGENLKETKLVNFYNLGGINFGNIAANDAVIAAKIGEMVSLGWRVAHITSGVESDGGKDDNNGIFITRIFFVKN
jgi:hypothetical protein